MFESSESSIFQIDGFIYQLFTKGLPVCFMFFVGIMLDFAAEGLNSGGGVIVIVESEDSTDGIGDIGDSGIEEFWHMHKGNLKCVCCD